VATEADAPAVRSERAGDEVEEGRLARSVRPHHADQLPLVKAEADVMDGADTAEPLRHPLHLEKGHVG
jgi:hypothetical protein